MLLKEDMLEQLKENYKKMKVVTIVFAILMVLLGIALFCIPESGIVIAMWLMFAGIIVRGVFDIVLYCKMPNELRDGWNLASGIIWIILAIILIVNVCASSELAQLVLWGNMEMIVGIFIGFTSIFSGIKLLCNTGEVKAMGGSTAPFIVGGILWIIVGLIVLSAPIGAVLTITIVYGLFLTVGGVALFFRSLTL